MFNMLIHRILLNSITGNSTVCTQFKSLLRFFSTEVLCVGL